MGSDLFIWGCIGLGGLGLISELSQNKVIKWCVKIGFGSVMLMVMNYLLPQYNVGFNVYTIGISTILGIPGVMMLYVVQMIL